MCLPVLGNLLGEAIPSESKTEDCAAFVLLSRLVGSDLYPSASVLDGLRATRKLTHYPVVAEVALIRIRLCKMRSKPPCDPSF